MPEQSQSVGGTCGAGEKAPAQSAVRAARFLWSPLRRRSVGESLASRRTPLICEASAETYRSS